MVIFTGNDTTANEKEINESLDLLLQKDHLPHISIVATVVLMICIIGPYLEELLFRGIFKETLFMKYRFGYHSLYLLLFLVHNIYQQIYFHMQFIF